MRMDELRLNAMAKTAEEIWSDVEAMPPSERRKLKARLDAAEAEEADGEGDLVPYPADLLEPEDEEERDRQLAESIERGRAGHSSPAEEVLARLAARRAAGA